MSYDNSWDSGDDDRKKIRELKKQADMLARIACKALAALEENEIEDFLLLKDDEVREWWNKHKEADRKERARLAEIERKAKVKEEALARLSDEEKELLGLAPKKSVKNSGSKSANGPTTVPNLIKKIYMDGSGNWHIDSDIWDLDDKENPDDFY